MAEVVGFNLNILKSRCETLKMVVQDLYEGGGDISKATFLDRLKANDARWYTDSWSQPHIVIYPQIRGMVH